MSHPINPCPFCGNYEELDLIRDETKLEAFVSCKICGASSGSRDTRNGAIHAWNMRAGDKIIHLKPCSKCGNTDPVYEDARETYSKTKLYRINCSEWGCYNPTKHYLSKQEAATEWNGMEWEKLNEL